MRIEEIIIVGAGPYGIGLATELRRLGKTALVLEQGDAPASAWRNRHPQLRLNTHRLNSGFRGHPIPRSAGRWPDRDDYVSYLDGLVADGACRIKTNQEVTNIDRGVGYWIVETATDSFRTRQVIFATGFDRVPVMPSWAGMEGFEGKVIHACDFGNVEDYQGKSVLVVGAGNSGTDVLNCLAGQPLKSLAVSIRNGPVIVPAELFGVALQLSAPMMQKLPAWLADKALRLTEWIAFGDVNRLGIRQAGGNANAASRLLDEHVAPAVDRGFVAALKQGAVSILPEINSFQNDRIVFSTAESRAFDVVICATGYETGLGPIVGHLGVLNSHGYPLDYERPVTDGLWFALKKPPLEGALRAISRSVRPLAQAIAAEKTFDPSFSQRSRSSGLIPDVQAFRYELLKRGL